MAIVYYKSGESVTLSSSNSEVGTTYVWKKGSSVISGETGKDYVLGAMDATKVSEYSVEATPTAGEPVTDQFSVGLVTLGDGGLTPVSHTLSLGDSLSLTVNFSAQFQPAPDANQAQDYSVTYQWKKGTTNIGGETTNSLDIPSVSLEDAGVYNIAATLVKGGTTVQTSTRKVADVVVEDVKPGWYVVPLSHLNSSFTWIGYWVIDEIKETPDWFDDHSSMKYKDEVSMIVKAYTDYGDCMLMESRNGRVLKVSDLK